VYVSIQRQCRLFLHYLAGAQNQILWWTKEDNVGIDKYKVILDAPAKNPALGYMQYANAFKDIIENSEPQFAIGIFGGWGSGKTTLMDAIQRSLNEELSIPVQFSAWRYEKEPHLIIPLLDAVRDALSDLADKEPAGQETARRTATTIGKVARSLLAGLTISAGVPGAMQVSLKANEALSAVDNLDQTAREANTPKSFYYAGFRALKDAFSEFAKTYPRRRMVVFVDDLDRCLPEGALGCCEFSCTYSPAVASTATTMMIISSDGASSRIIAASSRSNKGIITTGGEGRICRVAISSKKGYTKAR
jgi:hypothetical protein